MNDGNKQPMTPEEWARKKMLDEQAEEKRKENINLFLNDPDEGKKALKQKIWNEGLKDKVAKNPTIADNPAILSEMYLDRLELAQRAEAIRTEEAQKHKQTTPTESAPVIPPAANPATATETGGFFKDGKLDGSKVSKITRDLAGIVGIS